VLDLWGRRGLADADSMSGGMIGVPESPYDTVETSCILQHLGLPWVDSDRISGVLATSVAGTVPSLSRTIRTIDMMLDGKPLAVALTDGRSNTTMIGFNQPSGKHRFVDSHRRRSDGTSAAALGEAGGMLIAEFDDREVLINFLLRITTASENPDLQFDIVPILHTDYPDQMDLWPQITESLEIDGGPGLFPADAPHQPGSAVESNPARSVIMSFSQYDVHNGESACSGMKGTSARLG
jgi:hypothetical protein